MEPACVGSPTDSDAGLASREGLLLFTDLEALSSDLPERNVLSSLLLDSETLCESKDESEALSREDTGTSSCKVSLQLESECNFCRLTFSHKPTLSDTSGDFDPLCNVGFIDSDLHFSSVLQCLMSNCLNSS